MASTIRLCAGSRCIAALRSKAQSTRVALRSSSCNSFVGPVSSRWQSTAAAVPARTPGAAARKEVKENQLGSDSDDPLSFSSLKGLITHGTLKAITVKPFKMTKMTPVQAAVLPLLPSLMDPYDPTPPEPGSPPPQRRDLLVKARTGTGKTLAFLVPAIEARLRSIEEAGRQAVKDSGLVSDKALAGRFKRVFSRTEVGTLVISPTRELATQIANEALRLAHHHEDLEVRLFVGGMSKRTQMRDWMKGRRDIVVATPGRLLDLLNSEPEIVKGIAKTRLLVLDEADTLLDMGFRDDIEQIKEFLPPNPERQNFMFSATVSRQIQQIARSTLQKNHTFINTVSDSEVPVHTNVPQYHTVLPSPGDQIPHILRLIAHDQLTNPGKSKVMLFLPTTKMTQLFSTLLRELGPTVLPSMRSTRIYEIHSKRAQDSRSNTSDAFRHDKTGASVLVSSDISARGVDYPGVTRVIQLGIPAGTEQYIHRIGRTGRAGTSGGRGDLVLLPWEVGFVTWQLDGIPLKPVTTNELKSQLTKLAQAYDANPDAAFQAVHAIPAKAPVTRLDSGKPRMFATPLAPTVDGIPAAVDALLPSLDEEAVRETFASLLGYYMSKTPELRTQKGVIVQGCKDWATGACGLPVPPYVSDAFLQRMGFQDGRTKRFGQAYDRERKFSRGSDSPWGGRGMQKYKNRVSDTPSWARNPPPIDPNDPAVDPEQYRSKRYDARISPPHQQRQPRNDFADMNGGFGQRTDGEHERDRGFGAKTTDSAQRIGRYGERSRGSGVRSGGYGGGGSGGGGSGLRDRPEGYGIRR